MMKTNAFVRVRVGVRVRVRVRGEGSLHPLAAACRLVGRLCPCPAGHLVRARVRVRPLVA